MKIKRVIEGKPFEFSLTNEELTEAHKEYVIAFMSNVLQNDFGVSSEDATLVAEKAFDMYSEGNGYTEYECVQLAYKEWNEE